MPPTAPSSLPNYLAEGLPQYKYCTRIVTTIPFAVSIWRRQPRRTLSNLTNLILEGRCDSHPFPGIEKYPILSLIVTAPQGDIYGLNTLYKRL